MKKLRLKEKYKGLSVTRSDIRIGKITFDANTVKEEHYQNYYDLGFTELFEEIEVITEKPQKEILVEDKLVKPKRRGRKPKKDEQGDNK